MLVNGKPYRTIWFNQQDPGCIQIINQCALPHEFVIEDLRSLDDAIVAIRHMHVRGAPLIGATAAWGLYLAALDHGASFDLNSLKQAGEQLKQARPTAVNLAWAVDRVISKLASSNNDSVDRKSVGRERVYGSV